MCAFWSFYFVVCFLAPVRGRDSNKGSLEKARQAGVVPEIWLPWILAFVSYKPQIAGVSG